jgi:teichoic acid transport system ATP-binding protein
VADRPEAVETSAEESARVETVRAVDLHVRYRVYQDVKPTMTSLMANLGRRREYREVHAIQGVSFSTYRGEAVGIIGPNGSGKSTLMQAIAGLLPPASGEVYAHSMPMLLGVGAVLNRKLSGRRNILLGGLALGLTRSQVAEREQEIIDFAGLADSIDRPMKTYSSGMQSRLQFAISSAVEPEILIIDEALSVGDASFKAKSEARIRQLRESAGTVFLVSHSMGSIRSTCTRVLWIQDGLIQLDGTPDEVIPHYQEMQRSQPERDARAEKSGRKAKKKAEKTKRKAKREAKRRESYARQWATLIDELTGRGMPEADAIEIARTVWPKFAARRAAEELESPSDETSDEASDTDQATDADRPAGATARAEDAEPAEPHAPVRS